MLPVLSRGVPFLTVSILFISAWVNAQNKTDFKRDVYPVLERSCTGCHGAKLQMGNLRLDAKAAALKGGQSGAAIVPGKPDDSLLVRRILGLGGQARMPMGAKPLTTAQIAAIKNWITTGAEWPEGVGAAADAGAPQKHWAFVAPVRPPVPAVATSGRVRNPIDAFILARLERESLTPSPEADRITLLRRLSLDLTGLPPTLAEVDAYLADKSPDAYSKQVERLLASPHYGEKWGRQWLDAARFADSNGFEKDAPRPVWFYRDWVINSLNRDLPYNEFLIEQIAGDLLPNATQDQKVATGFLRNSMLNEEGGVDPEQFRMEAMFDRMDAIGKSMLGITIQCAQCHNHKYDPVTQEAYYRIFAFLNDSSEANMAVYTPSEQMKRDEIFRHIRGIEQDLRHRTPDWQDRMHRWETESTRNQPAWKVLHLEVDDNSTGGQKYIPRPDESLVGQGYSPSKMKPKLTAKTDLAKISAFRLDLLTDGDLPMGGPGRSIFGLCALTEFEVEAAPASNPKQVTKVKFVKASADFEQPESEMAKHFDDGSKKRRVVGPAAFAIDGKKETAWGIDAGPGRANQSRKAVFIPEHPIENAGGTVLTFYLDQNHGGNNSDNNDSQNIGRFRISVTDTPDAVADPLPARVRQILSILPAERSVAQEEAVFSYWRTTVPEFQEANARIEALWKQHPAGASQFVYRRREQPRETHMLARGDFLNPGKVVEPGVPDFLHPLPAGVKPDRLAFGRWIADRRSPTTARSMVNRIWQAYFGTGIVATAEDFGRQSEAPSHRELLDWLAVEFMDHGWSLKHLHRLIVNSSTYRQSSRVTPELYAKDPYNRLLARGPRFRVEAEAVRDITLAASGLLDDRVGGPSVYPPAPEFLFLPPASYSKKAWPVSTGSDRYRRGIYIFRFRSVPFPALQTFDAPAGDVACVRRSRSNTPLQALVTLNEPGFVEAARALAIRSLRDGGANDLSRLTYAFRRAVARPPSASERDVLLSFLDRQRRRTFAPDTFAFSDAELAAASGASRQELTVWTALARTILNLDETITKE